MHAVADAVKVGFEVEVAEAASRTHAEQSKQPRSLHITVPTVPPMVKDEYCIRMVMKLQTLAL